MARVNRFEVQAGMFPHEVTFLVGMTPRQVSEVLEEFGTRDFPDNPAYNGEQGKALFIHTWGNHFIVALPAYRNTPQWYSVAGHEVCHVCVGLLDVVGIDINKDTEEVFCYLHQFLMDKLITKVREK